MSDDKDYKLLIQALGIDVFDKGAADNPVLKGLIEETLKFRDKLKRENGYTLTVEDTRLALEMLQAHIKGEKFVGKLSPEQKALGQILIDRVVLFKFGMDK